MSFNGAARVDVRACAHDARILAHSSCRCAMPSVDGAERRRAIRPGGRRRARRSARAPMMRFALYGRSEATAFGAFSPMIEH